MEKKSNKTGLQSVSRNCGTDPLGFQDSRKNRHAQILFFFTGTYPSIGTGEFKIKIKYPLKKHFSQACTSLKKVNTFWVGENKCRVGQETSKLNICTICFTQNDNSIISNFCMYYVTFM